MPQGYYTLDQAAQRLGISPDELKQLKNRGELRGFQDGATLRFRAQEIDELARRRGSDSSPEVPLGEAPRARAADSPVPKSPAKPAEEVFGFSLDLEGEQGASVPEPPRESSSGKKSNPKSDPPKPAGASKPGSDSDVRLVADGSDLNFKIASDSAVKLEDANPKTSPSPSPKPRGRRDSEVKLGDLNPPATASPSPRPRGRRDSEVHLGDLDPRPSQSPSPRPLPADQMDSGVKLVDLDSDSDVKIIPAGEEAGQKPPSSGADSDVRLEGSKGSSKGKEDSLLTEEIDLDAEIRKAEEAARGKSDPKARALPRSKGPEFPTTSPFELSETDLKVDLPPRKRKPQKPRPPDSSEFALAPEDADSSSDFDLTPAPDSSSDFELEPAADSSSDDFQLEVADDADVKLGEGAPAKRASTGINIKNPADSGISLEEGGAGSEFELTLDSGTTPRPAPAGQGDSDSEFELTIDESGGLAPLEEETGEEVVDDKDIFETDFEVPALEDESGSQAIALDDADSDLDSSDFDIALTDQDVMGEDESGSQVVALDEEEEAARPVAPRPRKTAALLEGEEGFEDLIGAEEGVEVEEGDVEEEEEEPALAAAATPAAPWGPLPALVMLPSVLILVLVGLLGFELLQGLSGYHRPGVITKQISKIMGLKLPPD